MNDLDALARSAAGALRESVPDVVPEHPAPSRLPQVVAAAVVTLALAAAGLVALNQEAPTGVTAGTPGIPRFVVRDLPGGMEVSGATDLPIEGFDGTAVDVWLYGSDDLAPELTVLVYELDADTSATAPLGAEPYLEEDGLRSLTIHGGRHFYDLSSRTLDRAGLEAAAEQLAFDGDGRPTGVPNGLPLLATVTDGFLGPVATLVNARAAGHAIGYFDESMERQIGVMTVEGDRDLVLAAPQAQHPMSTRLVDVRGHEARLSTYAHGGTVLIWQEAPSVVVAMATTTLSESDLLAAAASLEAADEDEWAALLTVGDKPDDDGASATATTSTTIARDEQLTGTLADGFAWSITQGEVTVCAEVRDAEGLSRDCLPLREVPGGNFVEVTNTRMGEPALMWGSCPSGAASVDAIGPSTITAGPCVRFFGIDVSGGLYDEVVFRDADGRELARLPVDN